MYDSYRPRTRIWNRASNEVYFAEDLYHRINEFTLRMPDLKERQEDILLFANFFLDQANRELDKQLIGFDDKASRMMLDYHLAGQPTPDEKHR